MAAENSNNSASTSRSSSTADSYIGSLISLTSKSEIRYEGVLYNINTEVSSIGLKNVRSFGTEGRKKDGPQVPPSDRVYEYILFRGSDIKDLQVKSSPPVQPMSPIDNDPAIIQSRYPRTLPINTSLPSAVSGSFPDPGSQNAQMGLAASNFQGGLPLYQPGGSLGTWGASPPPPSANGSGVGLPMYWPGYYAPNGLPPHLHQQSLLRPPPGLSMPPSIPQQMQYPNFSATVPSGAPTLPGSNLPASFPDVPSPFLSSSTSSLNLTSTSLSQSTFSSNVSPIPSTTLASETLQTVMPSKAPNVALPTTKLSTSLSTLSPLISSSSELNAIVPPISNKPSQISGPTISYQTSEQPTSSAIDGSDSLHIETPTPSLITPGQLLQSGFSTFCSSQLIQTAHKDVEVAEILSPASPEPVVREPTVREPVVREPTVREPVVREPTVREPVVREPVVREPSVREPAVREPTVREPAVREPTVREPAAPILPLPVPSRASHKPNGAPHHSRPAYRGQEKGRGTGSSRQVTKFTEDFDFEAMNEKFNKDEVWDHLGKTNKSHLKDKEDGKLSDEEDFQDEVVDEFAKVDSKSVYNKDDFFDTLSCNTINHDSQNGRTRFSEQMKIDTETFGDFQRYRGGRGGHGHPRGGRSRGSYYGRGYGYGYGYGYGGRGRGRAAPHRNI